MANPPNLAPGTGLYLVFDNGQDIWLTPVLGFALMPCPDMPALPRNTMPVAYIHDGYFKLRAVELVQDGMDGLMKDFVGVVSEQDAERVREHPRYTNWVIRNLQDEPWLRCQAHPTSTSPPHGSEVGNA